MMKLREWLIRGGPSEPDKFEPRQDDAVMGIGGLQTSGGAGKEEQVLRGR